MCALYYTGRLNWVSYKYLIETIVHR